MRFSPTLIAAVLCAGSIGSAYAQQSTTPSVTKGPTGTARLPSGMSFAYDAQHGVISTTGIRMKTTTQKSNSVSPTEGVIIVTININVASRFEAGATYHCSVYALGGIIDTDTATVDGGLENANTFAVGSGGKYSCTIRIPYSWTLPHDPGADSGLVLAYGVAAVNPQSEVEHSTLQVDGVENLPANGATSAFTFNVAL
jgi:hypothetical protein